MVLTMVILSILQTQQLHNYLIQRQAQVLRNNRAELTYVVNRYESGRISLPMLSNRVTAFEKRFDIYVTLVDPRGTIIRRGQNTSLTEINSLIGKVLNEGVTPTGNGGTEIVTSKDVTFSIPLIEKEQMRGIAIVKAPVKVSSLYAQAFGSVFLSVLIALGIAMVATYFISRYLTKPLKDLTKAAGRIARGDFSNRVQVTTSDEIGQLAVAFNDMMYRLEELEGVRRDFIASVSHELRSPLTSIRGFVQGMLDKVIPEDEKEHYLTLTIKETQRLNRLIDQLLDAARIDSGNFMLDKERVDILQVIRHVLKTMEPSIREKCQHFQVDLPERPIIGLVDPDRLEQIVINLVSNACQYTPEKGKISFSLRVHHDKAEFYVSDTGEGISKEDLPHIWDRFFKADRSRTNKKVGTGLGLSIVKNLVEAHGGHVSVESVVGLGTKFTVTLPL